MPDENKDLNKSQSVADADLKKEQSVVAQDLNTSGQGEQAGTLADGTDENKTVKYSEFKKANDAKIVAEEALQKQTQDHQNQMALLQANQVQPQTQTQTQPLSDYDQAKLDLGLGSEEYLDETQRSSVMTKMTELVNTRNQRANVNYANQQFEITHPDFTSAVGLRNPITGAVQPSAEILKILTEKPYLTAAAYASSQGAYEIVMGERKLTELQQQNTANQEHLKQQDIDTKLAPVSGAAEGGGAVTTVGASVTIEQQLEMEAKVATGEFNQKG